MINQIIVGGVSLKRNECMCEFLKYKNRFWKEGELFPLLQDCKGKCTYTCNKLTVHVSGDHYCCFVGSWQEAQIE